MNVARDLTPFYNRGMKIWTRTESGNGLNKSDWQCSKNNVDVISFQQNDILRSNSKKKEYACGRYYNTLKFQCKFPEITVLKQQNNQWPGMSNKNCNNIDFEVGPIDQRAQGTVLCFAYAQPYTYCDLLSDLEQSKRFLLAHGGTLVNHQKSQLKPIAQ